jgi:hypothetical protein
MRYTKEEDGVTRTMYYVKLSPQMYKERSRPTKGQNRPNKVGKIELKF